VIHFIGTQMPPAAIALFQWRHIKEAWPRFLSVVVLGRSDQCFSP
jgi:hypothetical protein